MRQRWQRRSTVTSIRFGRRLRPTPKRSNSPSSFKTTKGKLAKEHWPQWQAQGLFVLFLPPYCSELNPIEGQWHQLKTHELAGRMFEYEDELTEAIVDGMIERSQKGEYTLDRFILDFA